MHQRHRAHLSRGAHLSQLVAQAEHTRVGLVREACHHVGICEGETEGVVGAPPNEHLFQPALLQPPHPLELDEQSVHRMAADSALLLLLWQIIFNSRKSP